MARIATWLALLCIAVASVAGQDEGSGDLSTIVTSPAVTTVAPTTTLDDTPASVTLFFLELFPVRVDANQLATFEQSIRDEVEAAGVDVSLFTPSPLAIAQTGLSDVSVSGDSVQIDVLGLDNKAKIEQRVRDGDFQATVRGAEQTASLSPIEPGTETTSFVLFVDPEEELNSQASVDSLIGRVKEALEDELIDADQMEYTVERVAGRDAAVVTATGDAPAPSLTAEAVRSGQLSVTRADGTQTQAASTSILDMDKENSDMLYLFITLLVLFFIAWALLAASCCCGMCTDYSYARGDRTTIVHGERNLAGKDLDVVSIYSSEYSEGGDVDAEVYTSGAAQGTRTRSTRGRNMEDKRFRDEYEVVPPLGRGPSYGTQLGTFPWSPYGGGQQHLPATPMYVMPEPQGSQVFYMPVSGAPSSAMLTPLAQEPAPYYYLTPAPTPMQPMHLTPAPFTPGPAVYSPPQYAQGQFQPQNVNQRQVFYTYESAA
eukprot:m.86038 g.86038  ORF g.86038 m.86038 type:complete len:487 (+) comp14761_c0_seq1:237-1697(+)